MKFRVKKSTSKHHQHWYVQQGDPNGVGGTSWIGIQACTWEFFFPGRHWIESYSVGTRCGTTGITSAQTREDLKAAVRDLNERGANLRYSEDIVDARS